MKRYELAKQKGLNWQVVLVQDCETDLKLLIIESVKNGIHYGELNKKIMSLINEAVSELDIAKIKDTVKRTLVDFASKIYLEALRLFGNRELGEEVLLLLKYKGIKPTEKYVASLKNLPTNLPIELPTYGYNRAVANGIYPKQYEAYINQILDARAKPDYSDRYTLRAYVEREVRNQWQENQIKGFEDKGITLVWIDTHSNCSERCQPFQGRLYSLNETEGAIDGIKYRPLSVARDIYSTTKAGKTYKNGCTSGFNCRHKLVAYKKGFKPQTIPSQVIEKQRFIETKQRELERKVRQYEVRAMGWKNINRIKYDFYVTLKKKWEKDYVDFSKENNVPIYPSRLKV